MVTTFYPPYHFGGDAIFVQALSRALVSVGHQVEVVHCEDAYRVHLKRSPVQGDELTDGIRIHRLRHAVGFLSPLITQQTGRPGPKARALRKIFNRDFDVVNFHNISLVGGPGILSMSQAAVNLYTLHEHWLLCPMHSFWKNKTKPCDTPQCIRCCVKSGIPPQLWRYTGLIHRSLDGIDAVLSPSHFTAERHRSIGEMPPIHVLPTFSRLAPEIPGSVHKREFFLYVGRITASKGIAVLVEEFSRLNHYQLLVVGEGDLLSLLRERFKRHHHIRFLGSLPEDQLAPLYQKALALILPSLAPEVFPLTVLEAFAFGTPAIVHNAGGSREAIDRTGGGLVYDSRKELQDAIILLAESPEIRDMFGRRARTGYEQWYSGKEYLHRYLQLIQDIRKKKSLSTKNRRITR